jgi:hypothetical protein
VQLTMLFEKGAPTTEEWREFVERISADVMQGQPA